MSIRKFSEVGFSGRKFGGSSFTPAPLTPYVRPADWPVLPILTESDQRFVGVHAVYENDGNFLALSAAGDYTVDWGDGITENFAANVVAYHNYTFADADLPAATSRGYKCAVVSLTMQAGQNLTVLNLHQKHNQVGLNQYSSGFLDIAISGQYLTDLRIGVQVPGSTGQNIRFSNLEQINIVRSDLRQCEQLFYTCYSLQSIIGLATSTTPAASLAVTFQDTGDTVTSVGHGLRNGDSVVFSSVVTTTGIAADTRYFIVGSTTDTFQVATTYGAAATSLTTNGSGTAIRGTNMSGMFQVCNSLQTVPLFNTATVTDISYMFNSCNSLQTVPLFNTAAVTNMSGMFNSCNSLQTVPLFNTAAVTNMSYMFYSCYSLQIVPLFNTAAVTNMSGMFSSCYSLQTVPLFNTAAVTDMGSMFNSCYSLQTVPAFNCYSVTTGRFVNMFTGCNQLANIDAYNFQFSFSAAGCKLSAAALDKLYGNLFTTTGQTITVSTNWGTATDNTALATAKGWTVSG